MTPTHKPLTALHVRPAIETSLFDFFKIGPGPSSSHTIGPMRAGHDFVQRCDARPLAGALLTGSIENLFHDGLTIRVFIGKNIAGDLN